jgi:hypothetical protein
VLIPELDESLRDERDLFLFDSEDLISELIQFNPWKIFNTSTGREVDEKGWRGILVRKTTFRILFIQSRRR